MERALGHQRAGRRSGASLDTTRPGPFLDTYHRNVALGHVKGSDAINPQGWEKGSLSETPPWLMDSGIPWRRVILKSPHQATDSRTDRDEGDSERLPFCGSPYLTGIQVATARGSYAGQYAEKYVERTGIVRRSVRSTRLRLGRFLRRFFSCGFLAGFDRLFEDFFVSSCSRIVRESPPVLTGWHSLDGHLPIWAVRGFPLVVRLAHLGWCPSHLVSGSSSPSQVC